MYFCSSHLYSPNTYHQSHTDTTTNTNTATGTATGEDPCAQTSPSLTPPDVILPNLHDWVRQAVTQWIVKCRGKNEGATVAGTDEKGRLVNFQNYGPNWVYIQQWTIKYNGVPSDQIMVDLWKAPNDMIGRSIYKYDQDQNLIEVRQVDSQQNPIVTGTIQRRSGGGFYQTVLEFFDSNGSISHTRKLYQSDDPEMDSTFYLFKMFGIIPKTVEQKTDLTPPGFLSPSSPTPNTDTILDRLNKLNKPSEPYGTATSTGTYDDYVYKSPFSPDSSSTPSLTPATDALMKKYGLDKLTGIENKLYTSPFSPDPNKKP
jgi:hypothetical protein